MRPLKLAIALMMPAVAGQSAAEANIVEGIWINPRGTVAVKTGPCGTRLCGHIVWASPVAVADARDSGVSQLIGLELLQDYKFSGARRWTGRVFVPDMGRSFSSTIEQLSAHDLKIQGCLIGGFLCKSQTWHRR